MTRDEILDRSRAEHAELEALLAQLTEEQMTQPGVVDGWSVKDVLAHLTFWEQRMLTILQHGPSAVHPQIVSGEEREAAINRINEHAYQSSREQPLAEVLAAFQRSFQQVLEVVGALSDEDLADTSERSRMIGWPARQVIIGNTYEHYQEHNESIRAWLSRGASARAGS